MRGSTENPRMPPYTPVSPHTGSLPCSQLSAPECYITTQNAEFPLGFTLGTPFSFKHTSHRHGGDMSECWSPQAPSSMGQMAEVMLSGGPVTFLFFWNFPLLLS